MEGERELRGAVEREAGREGVLATLRGVPIWCTATRGPAQLPVLMGRRLPVLMGRRLPVLMGFPLPLLGVGGVGREGGGGARYAREGVLEVGEGGLNAAFAGSLNIPVIMASGDKKFAEEFKARTGAMTIPTKEAITANAAKLVHPKVVRERLTNGVGVALSNLKGAPIFTVGSDSITIRLKVDFPIRADVIMSVPNMRRIDGYTVEYEARNMREAYRLIRMMYKFIVP